MKHPDFAPMRVATSGNAPQSS